MVSEIKRVLEERGISLPSVNASAGKWACVSELTNEQKDALRQSFYCIDISGVTYVFRKDFSNE